MNFRYKASMTLAAFALVTAPGMTHAAADLDKALANPENWAAQAGDEYNQRYSKLTQITELAPGICTAT